MPSEQNLKQLGMLASLWRLSGACIRTNEKTGQPTKSALAQVVRRLPSPLFNRFPNDLKNAALNQKVEELRAKPADRVEASDENQS